MINGAKIVFISSKSIEIADNKKAPVEVGLEGVENINYLQANKCAATVGMIAKPLAN